MSWIWRTFAFFGRNVVHPLHWVVLAVSLKNMVAKANPDDLQEEDIDAQQPRDTFQRQQIVPFDPIRGLLQQSLLGLATYNRPCRQRFRKFLELPAEVREIVYEQYLAIHDFSNRRHRRSKHGLALLRASRQLHKEASFVMVRQMVFRVHLNKPDTKNHFQDLFYHYDNPVEAGAHFSGRAEVFDTFRHFTFCLDAPTWYHARAHWQRSAPAFLTSVRAVEDSRMVQSIRINIGHFRPRTWPTQGLRRIVASFSIDIPWKYGFDSQLIASSTGQDLRSRLSPRYQEAYARATLIDWVGATAHMMRVDLWLESCKRKERLPAEVESVSTLLAFITSSGMCCEGELCMVVEREGESKESVPMQVS
ncbi:hypothetical protein LTR53_004687 [Teratosphaeriaceae sp. CCFEE 6253]|nr:hypothetical protein LTR53_004687 [Teratosphaeriaceae sp. CCFEE 6253]